MRTFFSFILSMSVLFVACDKNDSTQPTAANSDFTVTVENVATAYDYPGSGVFNTPEGATDAAPIFPGESYQVAFNAAPGMKLSFATMFVQSNDFFYAPGMDGVDLFVGNTPVSGDITSQVKLWDAGTEINQEPGLGSDQAPNQAMANSGASDPDNTVRLAPDTFGNLPAVADVIKVTLSSTSANGFVLKIENVSDGTTMMTSDGGATAVPLAPGVFVIYSGDNPLFTSGQADAGYGLESLAEDGDPSSLGDYLGAKTGITNLLAPGIWVVHDMDNILFENGMTDMGEGLEALAEDGDPSGLATAIMSKSGVKSSGVYNTPVGTSAPSAILPGESYSFSINAEEGDKLSLANMFVQSNDLFYAPDGMGIMLFDNSGMPVSGDFTTAIQLWDAGTEANEMPGFGLNQAPRQSGTNTGVDENGVVMPVDDGFTYPVTSAVIRVTIQAN